MLNRYSHGLAHFTVYAHICSLELSPPVYLDDPVAVMEYLVGSMASDVKSFSNVTVVGLFNKEHKQGELEYKPK